MTISDFDREFLLYHFKGLDEYLKISSWMNIDIPEKLYRELRIFIKHNQIENRYIPALFGLFYCCMTIFNQAKASNKEIIENADLVKFVFDIRKILNEKIIEINIIGKNRKLKIKDKEFIDAINSVLIRYFGENKTDKQIFHRLNYVTSSIKFLAMKIYVIFLRDFKIKFKSKNKLYEQIYDFLKLAGYYSILGTSTKSEIIKKLLQKKV